MILRNIIFILFTLGVYSFAQAQTPVLIGGGGICYTNGNPNSITALNSQNLGGDCFIAVDTVAELVYVYDESLGVGQRWTILKTDVTVGDKGEIYVYSPTNWMLDTISKIRFNTTLNGTILDTVGHLKWNSNDGTLSLGMGFGGVVYQMGEELFYPTVINKSGSIIYNGQLVMVDPTTGVQGDRIRVVRAITNGTYPSDLVMGVATMDIPIDGEGYITYFGYVREVIESNIAQTGITLNVGDLLYPSATEAGKFTNIAPTPPANNTPIAFVVRKPSVNNLTLIVRYNKSQMLSELDDVILTTPADNSFLYYKASDGLWRDTLISNIVTGTGSNDQLAYFTGSTTLGSLSTITYPSLTEISYVKGVTSSIQNQLNSKLGTTLNSANIFVGNASNVATGVALSGDATISNTGALTIANNAVSNAKFRQSALLSVVGNSTNVTANVADIIATSDHQVLRRNGTTVGFGAINLAQFNAVTGILGVANGGTGTSTTLTTGSIVFAGGSGVYSQDNANLFWDDNNNRLGIGNTSPQRTLHVTGEVRISDLTTDAPTQIVGADADGDLGALTLGSGFSITSGTLNYTPSGILIGSGTPNEIAYFNGAQSVASLPTATYPSLAELAQVKGVTSAIQTQLNAKLGTTLTSANIFVGNASNVATGVALSGDATLANTGALTIANNAVSNAKFRQSASVSVVGNAGATTANVADISSTADHQVLRRSGTSLGFGAINLAQSNAVTGILGVANGGTGTSTALTTGSVVFAGTSGVYSQDNANLFWDDNNNRLGIGTASPQRSLDILGSARITQGGTSSSFTLLNSSSQNILEVNTSNTLLFGNNTNKPSVYTYTTLINTADISGANLAFVSTDGASSSQNGRFGFSTSVANTQTTGINHLLYSLYTFTPTSGSAVYNGFTIAPLINQTGDANGVTRGINIVPTLTSAASFRAIEWNNSSGFGLYGTGTAVNYLNGNLGIKTDQPQRTLHVTGEMRVTDLTTDAPTQIVGADADGDLGALTLGSGFSITSGTLNYTPSGGLTGSGVNGQVSYWTGTSTQAGSNNLFWDATNSRLGIGTNSPATTLQVTGVTTIRNPDVNTDGGALGAELLSSTGWTTTGWTGTYATGFTHTTGNTSVLSNSLAAVVSNYYFVSFTITGRTAGTVTVNFGGGSIVVSATSDFGVRATTTGNLTFTPTSDFNGTISNISVKIVSLGNASITLLNSSGTTTNEIHVSSLNTNVFMGVDAGARNINGDDNVFMGLNAGQNNLTGDNNVFIGRDAGLNNTTGLSNTYIGRQAGQTASSASNNTFVGTNTGQNATSSNNTFIGTSAGSATTTGASNVYIGLEAGFNNTTGAENVFIGRQAGRYFGSGSSSMTVANTTTIIGYDARAAANSQSNQTVIGNGAIGNGSNTVTLGNSSVVGHYLSGVGAVRVPVGTEGERSSVTAASGLLRFNTVTANLDLHNGTAWRRVVDINDVTPKTGDIITYGTGQHVSTPAKRGLLQGTTNSSGELTLNFGTGLSMPDDSYVAVANTQSTLPLIVNILTKTTSAVTFKIYDDTGSPYASQTVSINYIIIDY